MVESLQQEEQRQVEHIEGNYSSLIYFDLHHLKPKLDKVRVKFLEKWDEANE